MTSRFACRSLVLSLSAALAFACSSGGESADDAMNGQTAADDDDASDDDVAGDDDATSDDDVADDDATSDDDVGPIDVPVPVPPGDDDVGDDDVGSGDDDAADDDVSDDDVTGDDDVADDDVVSDDDVSGDPPGVQCADYAPCSSLDSSACVEGESCLRAVGCDTAICIDDVEYCDLSCPGGGCEIGSSSPGSPECVEGRLVPGNPGTPDPLECPGALPDEGATCNHASDDDCLYEGDNEVYSCMCTGGAWECFSDPLVDEGPPGVHCGDYPICDPQGAGCDAGDNCMSLRGCDLPICIPAEEACQLSCPEPSECAILESYPEQLSCDGYVEAHEQDEPDEGHLFQCGSAQCKSSTQYCFIQYSGVAPVQGEALVAPTGSCSALPSECVGMASCECLGIGADFAVGQQCSEMDGAVTVELFAP